MKKSGKKKKKFNYAYGSLRVYKETMRPTIFKDKRKSEKYKNKWKDEIEGD